MSRLRWRADDARLFLHAAPAPPVPTDHASDGESSRRRVRGSRGELCSWATLRGTGPGLIAFPQEPLPGTFHQEQIGGGAAKIVPSFHLDDLGVFPLVNVGIERLRLACRFQKLGQMIRSPSSGISTSSSGLVSGTTVTLTSLMLTSDR